MLGRDSWDLLSVTGSLRSLSAPETPDRESVSTVLRPYVEDVDSNSVSVHGRCRRHRTRP